jgi:nucleoid-associated protein YgaU
MAENIFYLLKGVDRDMRYQEEKGILLFVSFLAVLIAFGVSTSFGQEEMSCEEYDAQLLSWQQREAQAQATIAEENENIEKIKGEIGVLDQKTKDAIQQTYDLLGITQMDVDLLDQEIQSIQDHIDQLKMKSSEELEFRRDEIYGIENDIEALNAWPAAKLPDMMRKIEGLKEALAELRRKLPKLPRAHTVVKGECLWVISGYAQIYDDPVKWPRIYRANKDKIQDPNLIFPGWVLDIPRGYPSTHTVIEGEYLSKIASYWEIYDDARQWPRIFEANRDHISDPDLIVPNQVLTIPRD